MTINNAALSLAAELETERYATSRCLERIPIDLAEWRPHEKSISMGSLCELIAQTPKSITHILKQSEINFENYQHEHPVSTEELLNILNENIDEAKSELLKYEGCKPEQEFCLLNKGNTLLASTKLEQITAAINHMIHHRGQLTVYMGMNNIAIPSIYGTDANDMLFRDRNPGPIGLSYC